jgi:hypothetical protein
MEGAPFPFHRFATALSLVSAAACIVAIFFAPGAAAKLLNSAGILLEVGGLFQVMTIAWMQWVEEQFTDTQKYPFGPPSGITRRLVAIENPDQPVRYFFQRIFYSARAGFGILLAGLLAQLLATWL